MIQTSPEGTGPFSRSQSKAVAGLDEGPGTRVLALIPAPSTPVFALLGPPCRDSQPGEEQCLCWRELHTTAPSGLVQQRMPSGLRSLQTRVESQPQQTEVPYGAKTPSESSPALPSAHTCSIQEPLVHPIREEAKQAMGPRHTLLQLLGRDWLIRIPVLHLTAEDAESPLRIRSRGAP